MLAGKRILIVIGGGIAAYKVLEVIRRLKERGAEVRVILTRSGKEFVTPMTVGALSGEKVLSDLFDPTEEQDIGHIVLSRDTDLILVAPATANLMARMANGIADELATASLLAAAAPIIVCPAMNQRMWAHTRQPGATPRNWPPTAFASSARPRDGWPSATKQASAACPSRWTSLPVSRLSSPCGSNRGRWSGRHVLVTSGPTIEPIDPGAFHHQPLLGQAGPRRCRRRRPRRCPRDAHLTARFRSRILWVSTSFGWRRPARCFAAAFAALPADVAVMTAAVSDWRPAEVAPDKIKKAAGDPPPLSFIENPDILATLGHDAQRPKIVVGFAAETTEIETNAARKLGNEGSAGLYRRQ